MTEEEIIEYLEKNHFHYGTKPEDSVQEDSAKETRQERFDRSKAPSYINYSYLNSRNERVAARKKQVAKRATIFAGLVLTVMVCFNGVKK